MSSAENLFRARFEQLVSALIQMFAHNPRNYRGAQKIRALPECASPHLRCAFLAEVEIMNGHVVHAFVPLAHVNVAGSGWAATERGGERRDCVGDDGRGTRNFAAG